MENCLTAHEAPIWHQCPELPLKKPVSNHISQSKLRKDSKASFLPTFQTLLCFPPEGLRPQEPESPDQFPTGCQHKWHFTINGSGLGRQEAAISYSQLFSATQTQLVGALASTATIRGLLWGRRKRRFEQPYQSASPSKDDPDATILFEGS